MSQKPVTPLLYRCFVGSFLAFMGSLVALVFIGASTPDEQGLTPTIVVLLILMVASGPVWYVSLGMLASRLGLSWLVWVGLSFIFSPVAPLVAFSMMLSRIKAAKMAAPAAP